MSFASRLNSWNRELPILVRLVPAILAIIAIAFAGVAFAQIDRIAAVVNDEAITLSELEGRTRLAMAAADLPDTPETRQRLRPQVLRTLIDEKLQLQEAARRNITVTDKELNDAYTRLARQNNLSVEAFRNLLAQRGVPRSVFEAQVRSQIAWNKLIQRVLRSRVEIGDPEVDAVLERLAANATKPQNHVAEIFLPVDSPEQEEQVRQLAERLIDQIRQGAPFSSVARQVSQGVGASNGGDLGWISDGDLAPELEAALRGLSPGQMSAPIRGVAGYHILLLRDRRQLVGGEGGDTRLQLRQLLFGLPPNPREEEVAQRVAAARDVRTKITGCAAVDEIAAATGTFQVLDTSVRLRDLPPPLARALTDLEIGEPSPPVRLLDGVAVYVVCNRGGAGGGFPSREEIANQLAMQRLDLLQRRLIRDLRAAAFIEIRV